MATDIRTGYELGMSRKGVRMLHQAAFEQLAGEGRVAAAPLEVDRPGPQMCCASTR